MSAATTAAVAGLTEAQAREITATIRSTVNTAWDLIVAAYQGRVWTALGYDSWDDYCETEFGGSRIRLPREERQEVVSSLRDQGMSLRAIAAATGEGYGTVRRAVSEGEPSGSPEKRPVTDLITADDLAELNQPAPPRTTGTDGKSYRRPEPKPDPIVDAEIVEDQPEKPARKAPRKPLPEAFWQATYDLTKAAERVARLADDDRFPQNAEKVATTHRGDLLRALDALQGVVNRLPAA